MTTRPAVAAAGRGWRRQLLGLGLAVVLLAAAACSDSKSSADTTTTAPTAAADRSAATDGWQKVTAPSPCACSDGSAFDFFVHRGDPSKVLFFLQGGGACFSADTCGPSSTTFTRNLQGQDSPSKERKGIFDLTNAANPFKDFSIVFVPYCTGDVHLGDTVQDYGGGVVVHHVGAVNGSAALTAAAATFPAAEQVVVAGESAGSAGSPLYAGLAHDVFPSAKVSVIADASAAYPGTESITVGISALWGTSKAIPPWPENEGITPKDWTLPGLFVQAGKHDKDLRIATINTAFDETQRQFVKRVGLPADDLVAMIDENTASIEAKGVAVHSWVGPGTVHTILGRPAFYDNAVNGTKVRDWVADFVGGKDVPDVHCTDCQKPPA